MNMEHNDDAGEGHNVDQQSGNLQRQVAVLPPPFDPRPIIGTMIVNFNIQILENGCSICFDDYDMDSIIREVNACRHKFHDECLYQWLYRGSNVCPLCRSIINKSRYPDRHPDRYPRIPTDNREFYLSAMNLIQDYDRISGTITTHWEINGRLVVRLVTRGLNNLVVNNGNHALIRSNNHAIMNVDNNENVSDNESNVANNSNADNNSLNDDEQQIIGNNNNRLVSTSSSYNFSSNSQNLDVLQEPRLVIALIGSLQKFVFYTILLLPILILANQLCLILFLYCVIKFVRF